MFGEILIMNNFVVKYLEYIEIKNYIIKSVYFLYRNNFYKFRLKRGGLLRLYRGELCL